MYLVKTKKSKILLKQNRNLSQKSSFFKYVYWRFGTFKTLEYFIECVTFYNNNEITTILFFSKKNTSKICTNKIVKILQEINHLLMVELRRGSIRGIGCSVCPFSETLPILSCSSWDWIFGDRAFGEFDCDVVDEFTPSRTIARSLLLKKKIYFLKKKKSKSSKKFKNRFLRLTLFINFGWPLLIISWAIN